MGADLNCREASRLLSVGCDRPLTAEETSDLDLHLSECLMCRNFTGQLKFLRNVASKFREANSQEP